MRKAGLKRNARRNKQQPNGNNAVNQPESAPTVAENNAPPNATNPADPPTGPLRRKLSGEEAALTAKNYRLAKELSDLRVRHREECKTVTRLTMENMNLASRCREAISHVAMLKKELSIQRRAAEASAMQRHQAKTASDEVDPQNSSGNDAVVVGQSIPSPSTTPPPPTRLRSASSSAEVASDMDKVDRILSSQGTPSPQPYKGEESVSSSGAHAMTDVGTEESRPPSRSSVDEKKAPTSLNQQEEQSPEVTAVLDGEEAEEESPLSREAFRKDPSSQLSPDSSQLSSEFFADFGEPSPTSNGNGRNNRADRIEGATQPYSRRSTNQQINNNALKQNERGSPVVRKSSLEDVPVDELMSDGGRPADATFFPYSDQKDNYNEGFPGDIQARKHSFSSERKKHVGGIMELDEEYMTPSTTPVEETRANRNLNSIDAFEASFDATFPTDFSSPKEETKKERAPTSTEIYNPFFPGTRPPRRDSGSGADKPWGAQFRDRPPSSPSHLTSPGSFSKNPLPSHSSLQRRLSSGLPSPGAGKPQIPSAGNSPSLSRRLSASQRGLEGNLASESPHEENKFDADTFKTPLVRNDFSQANDPNTPEKLGAAAARARYEKALQPRVFGTSARKVGTFKDESDHSGRSERSSRSLSVDTSNDQDAQSPSLALKRLQQRKVKERLAAASESSVSTGVVAPNGSLRSLSSGRLAQKQGWRGSSPYDEDDDGPGGRPGLRRGSSDAELSRGAVNKPHISSRAQPDRSLLGNLSPGSVRSEIQALDALASGSYHGSGQSGSGPASPTSDRFAVAGKLRRNVKQPVSYSEPALNSKLRRGDVYFPKVDDKRASPVFNHEDDGGKLPIGVEASTSNASEANLGVAQQGLTSSASSVRS